MYAVYSQDVIPCLLEESMYPEAVEDCFDALTLVWLHTPWVILKRAYSDYHLKPALSGIRYPPRLIPEWFRDPLKEADESTDSAKEGCQRIHGEYWPLGQAYYHQNSNPCAHYTAYPQHCCQSGVSASVSARDIRFDHLWAVSHNYQCPRYRLEQPNTLTS